MDLDNLLQSDVGTSLNSPGTGDERNCDPNNQNRNNFSKTRCVFDGSSCNYFDNFLKLTFIKYNKSNTIHLKDGSLSNTRSPTKSSPHLAFSQ